MTAGKIPQSMSSSNSTRKRSTKYLPSPLKSQMPKYIKSHPPSATKASVRTIKLKSAPVAQSQSTPRNYPSISKPRPTSRKTIRSNNSSQQQEFPSFLPSSKWLSYISFSDCFSLICSTLSLVQPQVLFVLTIPLSALPSSSLNLLPTTRQTSNIQSIPWTSLIL